MPIISIWWPCKIQPYGPNRASKQCENILQKGTNSKQRMKPHSHSGALKRFDDGFIQKSGFFRWTRAVIDSLMFTALFNQSRCAKTQNRRCEKKDTFFQISI